ncbi:MAG: DUF523 domain-containing protein [Sulfurovaceae bacterium]|nr:DUF523 domain-containing protein [Sulfurovaceae bacterium]
MKKEKLLISACLMGENVKYNGKNNRIELGKLKERYELVPFCPEVEGGLPTPRAPSEIVSFSPLKLLNIEGKEVTKAFLLGAEKTVNLAKEEKITKALLKANSPSCSSTFVYDGSFGAQLVEGKGVTTMMLEEIGIEVFDEYYATLTLDK